MAPIRINSPRIAGPSGSLQALIDSERKAFEQKLARQRDAVVVVHGTFANPPRDSGGPRLWWETGGAFVKALDHALEQRGSTARCYHPFDFRRSDNALRAYWTGWSGANSEVERRRGAYDLAEHLRALQQDDDIRQIHIVAHSHGGNVVRRAMRYLNTPWRKHGVIVCMGTPFFHFDDTAAWRRWVSRIHWPMLIVFAGIVAGAVRLSSSSANTYLMLSVYAAAAGALYSMGRYAWTCEGCSQDARAFGFRFNGDEAIQLLRSCAALASEPHLYVRDLLGGPAAPRELKQRDRSRPYDSWFDRLFEGRSTVWRLIWNGFARLSNLWNGPICRVAERVTTLCYRVSVLGSIASLGLILVFRPYRPPLRPFLLSRTPRLGSLFFHSLNEYGERSMADAARTSRFGAGLGVTLRDDDRLGSWVGNVNDALKGLPFSPETAEALAAFAAMVLYVVFYPADKLLGLPSWLGSVMTRFAILLGARAAATSAPGMDILASAFKGRRTGRIPEEVVDIVIPEALERDVERRLSANDRIDFAALRAGLDPAKRASLLESLGRVFTDVGLMHAQYYQDPRIVDAIAEVITRGAMPSWTVDPAAVAISEPAVPSGSSPVA